MDGAQTPRNSLSGHRRMAIESAAGRVAALAGEWAEDPDALESLGHAVSAALLNAVAAHPGPGAFCVLSPALQMSVLDALPGRRDAEAIAMIASVVRRHIGSGQAASGVAGALRWLRDTALAAAALAAAPPRCEDAFRILRPHTLAEGRADAERDRRAAVVESVTATLFPPRAPAWTARMLAGRRSRHAIALLAAEQSRAIRSLAETLTA